MYQKRLEALMLSALLASAAIACLAMTPDLKPGLWDTVSKDTKTGKTSTTSICVNKEYQDLARSMSERARNSGLCKTISASADETNSVDECSLNGTTWRSTSRGSVSPDLIHSVRHSEYVKGDRNLVPPDGETEMRFKGACPSDMVGGDMIMPDGSRHNALKEFKRFNTK